MAPDIQHTICDLKVQIWYSNVQKIIIYLIMTLNTTEIQFVIMFAYEHYCLFSYLLESLNGARGVNPFPVSSCFLHIVNRCTSDNHTLRN